MYITCAYIREGIDNASWIIIQPILSLFDSWSKIVHSKFWGEDLFHVYCLFPVVVIYTYLTYLILHSQLKVSHTNIQISPFSLYLSLTFLIISFVFHSSLVCFNNKYNILYLRIFLHILMIWVYNINWTIWYEEKVWASRKIFNVRARCVFSQL